MKLFTVNNPICSKGRALWLNRNEDESARSARKLFKVVKIIVTELTAYTDLIKNHVMEYFLNISMFSLLLAYVHRRRRREGWGLHPPPPTENFSGFSGSILRIFRAACSECFLLFTLSEA